MYLFLVCDWSGNWLLLFNIQKCKNIQFGNVKFEYDYEMRDSKGNIRHLIQGLGIHFRKILNLINKFLNLWEKLTKYSD